VLRFIREKIYEGHARTVTLKKNIIGTALIRGGNIGVSFLLVPLTIEYVSTELYGIWLTLSSIITWLYFFDMGFTHGLKNKLAEALSLGDFDKGKSLVSTTYIILILLFIPIWTLLIIAVPHINWCTLLHVNSKYQNELRRTLYILFSCYFLQMVLNTLGTVVTAFQRTVFSALFSLLGNVLTLILILLMDHTVLPSFQSLCAAFMGAPLVVLLIASGILYKGKYAMVSPSIKSFNKRDIKYLFNMGIKFFLIQIQVVIVFQSANVIISHLSDPVTVAQYNTAYKYMMASIMLLSLILTPLWPSFTEAYTKKDFYWMRSMYSKMTKVYIVTVLMITGMVLVSPWVYKIWLGDKLHIPFVMTLVIGIYMVIYAWFQFQIYMINGIGSIKLQMYVTLLGTIFHIPLSFFIGRYLGALGPVCSMIILVSIYSIIFTIQIRKIITNKAKGIWLA